MTRVGDSRTCWCGNADFLPFGPEYGECRACGTLVYLKEMLPEQLLVRDDETDYYGKKYWLEHQQEAFGYADIHTRARNDLTERNLHWLKALLKYRLPPADVLELGCAHGSFVALMRQAGYEASGVEMSPWVVAFGQETFGIPVRTGPVESLDVPPASLDVIALMDVLEHLPDPMATMRHCLELLKPDGLLLIQTPCFKEGASHEALVESKDRFLEMLIPEEHIYLFSQRSAMEFFRRLGAEYIHFEPAIFAHYDMFLAVSRVPLKAHAPEEIESALLATPNGRLALALFDVRERELGLARKFEESEADRAKRAEQIDLLTAMLKESETDRAARGEQIGALVADLRALFSRPGFRWLTRFASWPEVKKLAEQLGTPNFGMNKSLRTIAVDLTPVLPGGENGGAKIFVLELLRRLAEMAPQTQFVLLTQAASHEELASLDCPNMRRLMVVGPVVTNSLRPRLLGLASRVLPHLPARLRNAVSRLGYSLNAVLKRSGSGALLRDMGADLLFCPFTGPTYFEPGIPTVCTIYDLQYKTYPEFFAAEDVAHRDCTFIEACRRATALTAISDYSRDSAVAHGSLDPARIRTIHLRMAQRISPGAEHDKALLSRLGLTPQRYLIYPANFWKHKNHEMLLTAFGMACHGGLAADVKLVCTGAPGARQEWLMSAARTMNLGDRVLFPGYLPNAELAALMANCTGVVFPSLYEGFGLPVIEAMAAGVPVACSNATSLPEVAADAAILFDPRIPTQIAQAMASLVEDGALRARLIQAGQQRATEFSDAERMAREYWELFQYAVANEKHENLLTGAYADGWAGPSLNIQVAPAASAQTLEIEFSAPEWLPQPKLTVQASRGGKPQGVPFEVVRGANAVLSLPLEPSGGYYEIRIAPTFVPARSGLGEDQRELSAILQRCGIVRADGECIELFPEKVSA